ncbi:Crp/Fnr family transcriptional regulator [Nocardiopsis baichengensis]|uniref:Crp/Fnr family transcriptional regulator n=1 Tax=Nocardiopsis baichengensis TaxID=280240 RepID=UPI000349DBC0|nr:cyclic nucleotide-binding domain-containing protein [Nocardiopsis baichengensis]
MVPSGSEEWPEGTFMARIGPEARDVLMDLAVPRRVPAGRVLMSQGGPGDGVLLLRAPGRSASACVKVTSVLPNGTETLLGVRVDGDLVGEMGIVRDRPRTATVTTCTPTLVHSFSARAFKDFLDRVPGTWEAVASVLGDRLEWSDRQRSEYTAYRVPARLARALLQLAARHGVVNGDGAVDIGVQLSQAELGMLIGAREDAVGEALRRMREAGCVEAGYRKVAILDGEGLQSFADED